MRNFLLFLAALGLSVAAAFSCDNCPSGRETCSYELSTSANQKYSQYIDAEYCLTPGYDSEEYLPYVPAVFQTVIHQGGYKTHEMKYLNPDQLFCGSYSTKYANLNSTIAVARVGEGSTWVFTSLRLLRDCTMIVDKYGFDDENFTAQSGRKYMDIFQQCINGCSYRSGGQIPSDAIPASFEFIFTPFHGSMTTRTLMQYRATEGYSDISPTVLVMAMLNFDTVDSLLSTSTPLATKLYFAKSTVLLTAMLEYSSAFLDLLLPAGGLANYESGQSNYPIVEFMAAVVGQRDMSCGDQDQVGCPVLACGDTYIPDAVVISLYDTGMYPTKAFVGGALDGEPIPGDGCGPPFIEAYLLGYNSTLTGEEALGAALSLKVVKKTYDSVEDFLDPPLVGPFEDYIGSVCPHAAMSNADFLALVYGGIKKEAVPAGTNLASALCSSDDYDVTSGKLFVGGSEVWHFDTNVLYMPSEFEYAAWVMFKDAVDDYFSAVSRRKLQGIAEFDGPNYVRLLLMMKLRYRDTGAGGSARKGIDVLNTRTRLAADCLETTDAFTLTNHDGWAGAADNLRFGELNVPGSVEDICSYAAIIELITDWCQEALSKEIMSGLKASCEQTYKKVAQKTKTACESMSCSDDIMSGFLCTAVEASVGQGTCSSMDVMSYYLSDYGNACDSWSSMMGYCGDTGSLGFYSSSGGVYGAFFGYSSNFGSYYGGGWYGNSGYYGGYYGGNYGGYYGNYYSYGGVYRRLNARASTRRILTHEISSSDYEDKCIVEPFKGSEDSVECLAPIPFIITTDSSPISGDFNFLNMPFKDKLPCGSQETDEANRMECHDFGALMMQSLQTKLAKGKTTMITAIVEDLLGPYSPGANDGTENLTLDSTAGQVRMMVGSFLTTTFKVYMDASSCIGEKNSGACAQALVPIFPACDPEFEESLVRDSIEIKWGTDESTRCKKAPFAFGGTLKGAMKRLAKARSKKAAGVDPRLKGSGDGPGAL